MFSTGAGLGAHKRITETNKNHEKRKYEKQK